MTRPTLIRGEIYRVNLEPTISSGQQRSEQQSRARPCIILTLSTYNTQLRTVGVVPLTSSPRALLPLIVPMPSAGKTESMALCHQIRTIDKMRIGARMGKLSDADLAVLEKQVRLVYGL